MGMQIKAGELYQLGSNRLMCGDGTVKENVEMLMQGGQYADMVFTDPPYNQATTGGSSRSIGKQLHKKALELEAIHAGIDFKPQAFLSLLPTLFNQRVMNSYIFCNKDLLPDYLNFAVKQKYAFNVLVWYKSGAIPINSSHRPDLEYLIHFRRNAIWNNNMEWANYSKCLQYNKVKKIPALGNHPTPKPVELIANEIQISSNPNGIVVDLFGGSGSTLIAAGQTGRRCYMMEIDPYYCEVIIKRWQRITGGQPVLIGG